MMRKIDWKTRVYWGFQSGHPVFVNVNPYDISKKKHFQIRSIAKMPNLLIKLKEAFESGKI